MFSTVITLNTCGIKSTVGLILCRFLSTEKPSVAESIGIIKKFEPEVLEAEGSVGLGVAACVIMVVILAAIVLLDLTTIRDHLRFMKANIREYLEQLKVKFLCRPHVIHVSRESPGKDDSG